MSKFSSALDKLKSQDECDAVAVRPFSEDELQQIQQSIQQRQLDETIVLEDLQPLNDSKLDLIDDINRVVETLDLSQELSQASNVYSEDYSEEIQWSDDDDLIIEVNDTLPEVTPPEIKLPNETTSANHIAGSNFSPEGHLDQLAEAVELGLSEAFSQLPVKEHLATDETELDDIIVQEDPFDDPEPELLEEKLSSKQPARVLSALSQLAEVKPSLRKLCQRIIDQLPTGSPSSIVMLRCGEDEDTTTTVADIAVVLSQLNRGEVLVVDAASQTRAIDTDGSQKQHGVYQLITDQSSLVESIFKTSTQGVSLLPCGADSALLDDEQYRTQYSSAYGDLLEKLQDRFQFILIDGGSISSFSKTLITQSDSTFLVAQLHETSRKTIEESCLQLQRWNQPANGCILLD